MRNRQFNIPISIDFAVLILRVVPSLFMLTHGYGKLMKLIGGDWSFADPIGIGEGLRYFWLHDPACPGGIDGCYDRCSFRGACF